MNRFLHSVRLRLTLWYAGVLAVVLLVFALSVYIFVVRTLQTNIDQALQGYGQQMNPSASTHTHGSRLDVKNVKAPKISRQQPIIGFITINNIGQAKVVKKGKTRPNDQPLRQAIYSGNESCGFLSSAGVGRRNRPTTPQRYCIHLFKKHNHTVGGVEVIASLAGVDQAIERLRIAMLLGMPLALLLAGSGGWLLAGRALEPVNRVTEMARSISATDLSRRINLGRHDELGRLAGTFDDMIGRLERAFLEQRQLTADVSHELRSPLTILEAQTSLALRRARSPDEYRQILASVQEEVEHMSTMVNQLLTLARADAGEEEVVLEPVNLTAVAEPVTEGMQPVARARGIRLQLVADDGAWVQGDAARLRQLIVNLLDNAVRHTPPGGTVDVLVGIQGNRPYVRVIDTGEGISPTDLPHVFHRFYRGDRARQRSAGNSGLGLAIVQWIVEAHGGQIRVYSSIGEGAEFAVMFPAVVEVRPALLTGV